MTHQEKKWQELDLLETEARTAARIMSTPDQQWEKYLADSGFFRIRPKKKSRADSIADFVEDLIRLKKINVVGRPQY